MLQLSVGHADDTGPTRQHEPDHARCGMTSSLKDLNRQMGIIDDLMAESKGPVS